MLRMIAVILSLSTGFAIHGGEPQEIRVNAEAILTELDTAPEATRAVALIKFYTKHVAWLQSQGQYSDQIREALAVFLKHKYLRRLLEHAKKSNEQYNGDANLNPGTRKEDMQTLVSCIKKLDALLAVDPRGRPKVDAAPEPIKEPESRNATPEEIKDIEARLDAVASVYEKESYMELIRDHIDAPEVQPEMYPMFIEKKLKPDRKDTLLLIAALKARKENWFVNKKTGAATLFASRADRALKLNKIGMGKIKDGSWRLNVISDSPYAIGDSYEGLPLK